MNFTTTDSNNFQSDRSKCAYCGAPVDPNNKRKRFCSTECLQSYARVFNRNNTSSFSVADELSKLQEMISHEASRPDEDHANTEQMLGFYEQVIERTGRILRSLNTNAVVNEHRHQQELQDAKAELSSIKRKMTSLLRKAGDLKKENDQLKQLLRKRKGTTSRADLARVLLGVDADDDLTSIRKAFRAKVKKLHPDQKGDADVFKALAAAFETLKQLQEI
ncbi:MAG: DnaJ domain-containing protein [Bacteroidota bacterium]